MKQETTERPSKRWSGLSKSGWIKAAQRAKALVAQQDRLRRDGTLARLAREAERRDREPTRT